MRDKRRNRFALPIGRAGRVALIGMVGLIGVAAASGQGSANADGKQLLREAHAKSQSAKTLQQYAEVIELCRLAAERPLSENLVEYARNLRAWAHNQRGEYYAEQAAALSQAGQQDAAGQMDKLALAEFVHAIELNPDYWKAIHNRGVGRALAGRLDEAAADFSRAIGLKPDYANSWFNRGEIHSAQGKFDAAIADYTRAVQLDDRDADTRLRRGYAYFQTRQFSQALADYDRAIELAPGNVEALVHRAEANRSLGRWQRAADDYLHAMRIDSGYGPAYRGAAWLMATCPEAEIRNADMALRAAQQALQLLGRDDHLALDALAAALANDGQFGKARTAATQAIQAAPQEHAAPLQKRLALYQKNQPYREQVPHADRQ
jgi:tetratricopeptide (TPR) repeat protein